MSVYKSKNSPYWQFDFVLKKQRYYGSTGCTSKRDAEEYERRERRKAALPSLTRPPITLDEACGLYEEHASRLPSWKTIEYMLAALVKGIGARRLLSEISQRELQVYFAKRRDGRSSASVNREIENARAVWRRASAARYDVGEMPDWQRFMLKVPKQPPRELGAQDEEPALFGALAADVFDVVAFALESGWRRAEVIGLRWADCHLQRAEARTKIKGGDTIVRPLTSSLVAIIANQPRVGPFVFTYVCRKSRAKRRKGQRYPMTVTVLRDRFAEAKKAAKVEGFRIHDLRHTAATRILRATQNLALTKEALAHTRIETTMRYAHVLGDDVRQGLDAAKSRNIPELRKAKAAKE